MICPTTEGEYFCAKGWTGFCPTGADLPVGCLVGWVERSDTHLFFCEVDGYRFAPPILRPAISGDKAAAQLAEEELERIVGGYIGETEKNRN